MRVIHVFKLTIMKTVLSILFTILSFFNITFSQSNFSIKSYKCNISGTSSMHDWTVDATKAMGTGVLELESNQLTGIKSLEIRFPVKDLKSTKKSNGMDKKMYETLQAKDHPDITFKLNKINTLPSSNNGYSMTTIGTLTIAGVSREEMINVKVKVENNLISFSGSKKLKMSDYKIKPPTAMLGMLSTGDDLVISFDCNMQRN